MFFIAVALLLSNVQGSLSSLGVFLNGVSRLPVGVIVGVHGCSSTCGPVMDWRPVKVDPCL